MMFSCCDPRLSEDVQVALVLNILCGFGAHEIASAFLSGRAAIEKRISRGKKVLASSRRLFDLADAEFASRLSAVRRALYLLFNEGYHGASGEAAVRVELCGEAMRLTALLREYPAAATPATDALAALMCLHAARLPARLDSAGDLNSLARPGPIALGRRAAGGRARAARALGRRPGGDGLSHRGGDRRRACERAERRGDRLAVDRLAVRPADGRSLRRPWWRSIARSPSPSATAPIGGSRSCTRSPIATGCPATRSIPPRWASWSSAAAILSGARTHFQAALGLARNAMERRFLEKRLPVAATAP